MPAYKYNRVFLIVMDSVGIGEAPDAADFNDEGAHTLGHIAEHKNTRLYLYAGILKASFFSIRLLYR